MKDGRPGEAIIALGFTTTNQAGPKVTDGRYVTLRITDGTSWEILVDVQLSAAEFMRMISGETIRVTDGVMFTEHPGRIGLVKETEELRFARDVADAEVQAEYEAAAQAIDDGVSDWDEVSIGKHSYGKSLHFRRWRHAPTGNSSTDD